MADENAGTATAVSGAEGNEAGKENVKVTGDPELEAIAKQARNPEAVTNAIMAEREARKASEKESERLRKENEDFRNKDLSEKERLEKERDEAVALATKETAERLRFQVAASKGLTPSQAERLRGGTLEELEKDADIFLAEIGSTQKNAQFEGGARGAATQTADMDTLIRRHRGHAV